MSVEKRFEYKFGCGMNITKREIKCTKFYMSKLNLTVGDW